MELVTLLVALVVLLAVRSPLFVVIGAAAMLCFALWVPGYQEVLAHRNMAVQMADLISKSVLLAIPFFVIAGAIMSAGGIARRLVGVAEVLVGHLRGGLAIASVLACMIFAAISGSSVVTLIAVGSLMYPAMIRAGYRESFSLGLITTAGSLGCLLPPSIPMLVYAISVTGSAAVEVGDLFISGLLPAVLIAGMLALYSFLRGAPPEKPGVPSRRPRATLGQVGTALREGVWALLMPVLVLGGIGGGVFKNATEASAVAVVYAAVVELLIHRELKLKDLPPALLKSVSMMGALLLIIVISFGLNSFMVEKQAAEAFLEWIRDQQLTPVMFMLAINVFLIVTGALMDSISAIVLFTPIIAPAAVALGIDPLHLGIVFIVNMEIGYVAPPIATNLFVTAQLFQKPFGQVVRAVMPSLAILCVGLVVVTYVPTLSIGPVYAMRGESFAQPFGGYGRSKGPPEKSPETPAEEQPAQSPVLTLEEMMRKAKEQGAADAGSAPAGRVLTLEEMMRAAKDRAAEADAGAP